MSVLPLIGRHWRDTVSADLCGAMAAVSGCCFGRPPSGTGAFRSDRDPAPTTGRLQHITREADVLSEIRN
jgi:hypothetical protein